MARAKWDDLSEQWEKVSLVRVAGVRTLAFSLL